MEYNKDEMKFAVIQDGYALFGYGKTKLEACENAISENEDVFREYNALSLCEKCSNFSFVGDLKISSDPEEIKSYLE